MKLCYLIKYRYDIILSCISSNSKIQVAIFYANLTNNNTYSQFEQCESIYGHNVLYSTSYTNYYAISDAVCNGETSTFEKIQVEYFGTPVTEHAEQSIENYEFEKEEKDREEEKINKNEDLTETYKEKMEK